MQRKLKLHDKDSNPIFMEITAAHDPNIALIGHKVTCREIVIPENDYPIKTNLKVSSERYSYLTVTLSFPLPNSGAIPFLGGHEEHLLCTKNKRLLLNPLLWEQ